MGNVSPPRVSISSITFSGGAKVLISENDVVLVVGPNNAGKSAGLRGIKEKLQDSAAKSPVLQSIEIQRTGGLELFKGWLSDWTVRQVGSPPSNPVYQALGQSLRLDEANHGWKRVDHILGGLTRWFCHLLSADERLTICNPPKNIALVRDNPSHPIHFLLRNDDLEMRLSAKFRKAFGVDLIVHRNAGREVPLHIGERPTPMAGEDRVSVNFVEKIEKLPTLHAQGDGMRSFAGVLLATSVGRESILLIDEPEAFLHPPQARLLGATLVQDRNKERQLFIATHSTDILRGVLDAESPDVKVLRIQRNGDENAVRLLDNMRIKELWGDPLLRYSNILDGLFHERVVVCEADGDCRFYAAVLDAVMSRNSNAVKRPDLMFTHCGGKARLSVVIRALREVDVPVRAVADFDVLSKEQPLRSIVESLGVDWTEIHADWRTVKNAVDSKKPDLNTVDVKKEIDSLFAAIDTPNLPTNARSDIQTILKQSSPWANAKLGGTSFVPSGDPSQACQRLLSKLRSCGLFVVEVGEIEGFVRSVGGHGPKWVNAVLARDLATDSELEAAREFVRDLAEVGLVPSQGM